MQLKVINIQEVAEAHMCCGCGACAYMSPTEIRMVDVLGQGRRPLMNSARADNPRSAEAMLACPGIALDHTSDTQDTELIRTDAGLGAGARGLGGVRR